MKRTILFALLILAAPLLAQQTLNPTVRVGATLYNCSMVPSGYRPQSLTWLFGIVDYVAECPYVGDLGGYLHPGTDQQWAVYLDSGNTIPGFEWLTRPNAYPVGSAERNAEDLLMHSTVDFDVQISSTHLRPVKSGQVGVDQFGFGELMLKTDGDTGDGVNSRNGVLLCNAASCADVTVNAYCNGQPTTADPCKNARAAPVAMTAANNTLFIGYDIGPFDRVNFTFAAPQAGGSLAFSYWNGGAVGGGWDTLPIINDGTRGFTQDGTVTFTPPLDWARHSISGPGVTTTGPPNPGANTTQAKHAIKIAVSAPTTYPTFARITGDDWSSTSTTTYCAWQQDGATTAPCWHRGWKFSACVSGAETLNNGAQYCANPPASSSARFEYQARMPAYLTEKNRLTPNPWAKAADGTLLWPYTQSKSVATEKIVQLPYASVNAVMNDNYGLPPPSGPNVIVPPWNYGEYADAPCATWPPSNSCSDSAFFTAWAAAAVQLGSNNRRNYGTSFQTQGNVSPGWNTGQPAPFFLQVCRGLDWCGWESFATPFNWGRLNLANWQAFANPSSFPLGTVAQLMVKDTYWSTPLSDGTHAHAFGFGNRSPMVHLAGYLLFSAWQGSVNKTALAYTKASTYNINNDAQVWNNVSSNAANSTLAAPLAPATCTAAAPCDIYLTADDQVTASGSNYNATLPVLQICAGPSAASCNDDADVLIVTKIAAGHYQTAGATVGTEYVAGVGASHATYPAGSFMRYASQMWQGVGSPYIIPSWKNVRYWATAFPAETRDYGQPDPAGYNGGLPNMSWLNGTAASGLPSCTGGCDPIARRSFRNATGPVEVLAKMHGGTQDLEIDTYSPEFALGPLSPSCAAQGCVYQQVFADGTLSAPSNTVGLCPAHPADIGKLCLRGAEAAILVTPSGGGGLLAPRLGQPIVQ